MITIWPRPARAMAFRPVRGRARSDPDGRSTTRTDSQDRRIRAPSNTRHAERTERRGGLAPPIVTRTRPRWRRGIQIPDERVSLGPTPLAPTIQVGSAYPAADSTLVLPVSAALAGSPTDPFRSSSSKSPTPREELPCSREPGARVWLQPSRPAETEGPRSWPATLAL